MQNTNTAQLIPIATQAIAGEERQAVNARELHAFLEVESKFADWIKNRIEEYGFIENADFLVSKILDTKPTGRGGNRKPIIEYFLTLDTAKELAMVERNAKGREARRYFIECERQAKQAAVALPDFTNPAEAARAWAAEVEKNAEQRKTLIEQGERLMKAEPKAAIDSGVMVQVAGISERNGRQYTQALVTARGLAKLAVFLQEQAA